MLLTVLYVVVFSGWQKRADMGLDPALDCHELGFKIQDFTPVDPRYLASFAHVLSYDSCAYSESR